MPKTESREAQLAAHSLGADLQIVNASTERDFDGVFANLSRLGADGLVIAPDPLFTTSGSKRLGELTVGHAVPAISSWRDFAAAGGLLSYGADDQYTYHLAGIYTGRILKGEKPTDLPVQQSTKVEFIINLKTAKVLGLTIPVPLQGRADELIE